MICTVDVLSMFVPCLFQYSTLCDVQILPCPAQFHQYQQQTYNTWLRISLEMLPICYFKWMLTLLYFTCMSMYLRRVITADAFVCRRGELHPMSYSISHNLCNCSLTSTHLLVACRYTCQWHWSTLRPGGTARLRRHWLWASSGQDEVPQQLPLRTYQVCTHQFNLTNTSCN